MSVTDLSTSTQNYIKVIWGLQEWTDQPITVSAIVAQVGLHTSTVSGAVSKLVDQGLLARAPYGAISLTEQGRTHALTMVRRHRLIETFLVDVLGYSWDQVHHEADALEHVVSELLIDRIDAHLGHPTKDPHGDPIPTAEGAIVALEAHRLTQVVGQGQHVVERICDQDPDLLRFFADQGITVGSCLAATEGDQFSGTVIVELGEQKLPLGRAATDAVWVAPVSAITTVDAPVSPSALPQKSHRR